MQLTQCQEQAKQDLLQFLMSDEQVHVLAGAAGTGKTALIKEVEREYIKIQQLQNIIEGKPEKPLIKWQYLATTHKATHALSQATGEQTATVHSYFRFVKRDGKFVQVENPKRSNVIIPIDEASYIDQKLLKTILETEGDFKVIFMGDPAQLTPVRSKFSPVFDCGFKTSYLKELVRQRNTPLLGTLCNEVREAILNGTALPKISEGPGITRIQSQEEYEARMIQEFSKPDWMPKTSRVLAWTNLKVEHYNQFIAQQVLGRTHFEDGDLVALNSAVGGLTTDSEHILHSVTSSTSFGCPGQNVGIGHRQLFTPASYAEAARIKKMLKGGEDMYTLRAIENSWADIRFMYASTVNKAQGSTFDRVFIDLADIARCNDFSQVMRMIYVAISRAKYEVIFIGDIV